MFYLVWMVESILGYFAAICRDAWNWTHGQLSALMSWLVEFAGSLLPSAVVEIMSTDMLKRVYAFFEFIDGLVPVTEMFSIWVSGLAAVMTIRAARWVFACIPTLGG